MIRKRSDGTARRGALGALAGKALLSCALATAIVPSVAFAADGADAGEVSLAPAALTVQDEVAKANYGGSVTASLTAADTVTISGYAGYRSRQGTFDAMANPKVTITSGGTTYATDASIGDGGVVTISGAIVVGTYTAVISSDNYNDKTVEFSYPAVSSATIGGVGYEYLDASTALTLVDDAAKSATLASFTQIGETGIYYKVADGQTALSGTLYGMDMSAATSYSALYNSMIEGGNASAADYDAISSATGIVNNNHYSQLSELVARDFKYDKATVADPATTEEQKLENKLVGAYCTPATVSDATGYVEAFILKAAGKEITADQQSLLNIRLNGNATVDPATVTDRVAVDTVTASGFFTSCTYFDPTALAGSKAYGQVKFIIRPTAGANATGGTPFSWNDYYASVYAGTISDGTTTVGMAPWIDLYTEAGHSAVEMSINNGTNPYNTSNKATVNRFASMYDPATGSLKAGDYTITVYAAGYNPLTYTFKLGAAKPSDDLKSLTVENAALPENATATVEAYSLNTGSGNIGTPGEVYAEKATVTDNAISLDSQLVAGDYKVTVYDGDAVFYTYTFKVSDAAVEAAAAAAAAEADIANGTVALAQTSYTYTGSAFKPAVTVKSKGGVELSAGTDYTVAYKDNVNAGTATVAVTGKGAYTGSTSATFTIAKTSIAKAKIALSKAPAAYTGKAQKGAVKSVSLAGKALKSGTDFAVSAKSGKNAGAYKVTVTGKGNYTGSASATFTIAKAAAKAKVTTSKTFMAKNLKKKAASFKAFTITTDGKVAYKVAKKDKKKVLSFKNGKVTVKKGAKAGIYTMKVKVSAKAGKNYKALAAKTYTVTVKVK